MYPRHFGPNMKDQLTNKLIAKAAKAHAHAPPTIEKSPRTASTAAFPGGGHLLWPLRVHHYGDRGPRARQREDPRGYAACLHCWRVCTAGVSALLDAQPFLRKPCGWRTLWSGLPNRPQRPRRDISDAEEVSKRLRSQGAAEQNAPHAKRSTRSAASPLLQPYHASLRLRRRGSGHVPHEVRRVIQT